MLARVDDNVCAPAGAAIHIIERKAMQQEFEETSTRDARDIVSMLWYRADGSRLDGGRLVPTVIVSAGPEASHEAALAEPDAVEAG
uniref:Uncharacterized protein n=3 Tax=Burkholderia gladioli TaxID=28095 RepID=A0A4D8TUW1_BURGA|nr:unnamed protein product [Burkholderia gladioli]